MTWWLRFRFWGLWWALPVAVGVAVVVFRDLLSQSAIGYAEAIRACAVETLPIINGLMAGAVSWGSGHLRRGRVLTRPGSSRPLWRMVLPDLASIAGVVALVVALLSVYGGMLRDVRVVPSVGMLGAVFTLALGFIGWAFLLGYLLDRRAALPTAVLSTFLLQAFPPSLSEPVFLRHMTGAAGGFGADRVTHPLVWLALCLSGAGLLTASYAAVKWTVRSSQRLPAAILMVVGVGLLGGSAWAVTGTVPRSGTAARVGNLICEGAAPQVCVWPEHQSSAHRARAEIDRIFAGLARRQPDLPGKVTEDSREQRPDLWVVLHPQAGPTIWRQEVFRALAGQPDNECIDGLSASRDGRATLRALDSAHQASVRWWSWQAGPQKGQPPSAIRDLLALAPTEQRRLVDGWAQAAADCAEPEKIKGGR